MWPRSRGTIRSSASFMPRITPWRLMSIIRRAVRSSSSMNLPDLHDPGVVDQHVQRARAALRRRRGTRRTTRARSRPGAAPPSLGPSSEAVACAASRSRSPIATRMPWRRSAWAVARPIPRAAPVIAAVWPARMRGCLATVPHPSAPAPCNARPGVPGGIDGSSPSLPASFPAPSRLAAGSKRWERVPGSGRTTASPGPI